MSGAARPNLKQAVQEYIADPCRSNAKKVDVALEGTPDGTADALWLVLELAQNLKGDLAVEKRVNERLEAILKNVGTVNNNNILQSGGQNAAQTGDGSQSVSGTPEEKRR